MKQTIVFQDQGAGSMEWELELSPFYPDIWTVTNVVLSGGPVGLWIGRTVRFHIRTKDQAELVWLVKGEGWFPLDIPIIEHRYHKETPVTESVNPPDIFAALRVLTHFSHRIVLACGRGKLLVLNHDQELDLVDDPRVGYDASTFPTQALVREGETLTLEYDRCGKTALCSYMIGSNTVLVSYATKEDPIHDDSAKELVDYLKGECSKIGVNLRVEART